jgi:hypothetical protein
MEQGSKDITRLNFENTTIGQGYKQLLCMKTYSKANYSKHLEDNTIGSPFFLLSLLAT